MADISVICPHCQSELNVPDSMVGQQATCPVCDRLFVLSAPSPAQERKLPPPPPLKHLRARNGGETPSAAAPAGGLVSRVKGYLPLVLSAVALLTAAAALAVALSRNDFPRLRPSGTREGAVTSALNFEHRLGAAWGDYFEYSKGDEVLKSLKIKEIKSDGNFAVAFYTLSLGATEVKKAMFLYRTNDGYWIRIQPSVAEKKCSEKWFGNMQSKIRDFTRNSGSFDETDF